MRIYFDDVTSNPKKEKGATMKRENNIWQKSTEKKTK